MVDTPVDFYNKLELSLLFIISIMFLLKVVQLIVAIMLIASILLQNRGTGLSGAFGGSGNVYMARRGVDRMLHWVTIGLSLVFFGISLVAVLI